jgi:hypothetical protein
MIESGETLSIEELAERKNLLFQDIEDLVSRLFFAAQKGILKYSNEEAIIREIIEKNKKRKTFSDEDIEIAKKLLIESKTKHFEMDDFNGLWIHIVLEKGSVTEFVGELTEEKEEPEEGFVILSSEGVKNKDELSRAEEVVAQFKQIFPIEN